MELFYDVGYDLTDYKGNGNLLLTIPETLFDLSIVKTFATNQITGSLTYISASSSKMKVQVYPDNGYTQLTARELMRVANFRFKMTDAFNEWNKIWQDLLDQAMAKYPFPEMCYYCY